MTRASLTTASAIFRHALQRDVIHLLAKLLNILFNIIALLSAVRNHTLFLQPVKPRWPCICICMYMVRVGVRVSIRVRVSVRVWVRFRVCHDMFRTRSSMFNRLQK